MGKFIAPYGFNSLLLLLLWMVQVAFVGGSSKRGWNKIGHGNGMNWTQVWRDKMATTARVASGKMVPHIDDNNNCISLSIGGRAAMRTISWAMISRVDSLVAAKERACVREEEGTWVDQQWCSYLHRRCSTASMDVSRLGLPTIVTPALCLHG